jgi:dihydrofolate reductase
MRRLIVTENMSFDGVVSPLGGWFDPGTADEELTAFDQQHRDESDALLLGRTTFEEFAGYWPDADDEAGVSAYLNGIDKYVVSRTLTEPGWVNTTVLAGDPMEAVADLRAQEGRDITVTGSVTLVHALLAADLVDEVRVFVHPAVQGEGRRLFPPGPLRHLGPIDARVFPTGVVYLAYDPRARR